MERTITINMGQRIFVINEDAYYMLKDYLTTLRQVFAGNNSSDEIISDIESSISDIFAEKYCTEPGTVITIDDVREVINRVGRPEDFSSCDNDEDDECHQASSAKCRKLFRDPCNKVLGGVCSGLGVYLNVDPLWIRILFICLTLFTNIITVVLYVVLCIIIPEAKTPADRMAMEGQAPTLDNIAQTVTRQYDKARDYINSNDVKSKFNNACNGTKSVFTVIFKILFILVAIAVFGFMAYFIVGMGSFLLSLIQGTFGFFSLFPIEINSFGISCVNANLLLLYSGITLLIGIPLLALIMVIYNFIFASSKPISKAGRIILLSLWIIGIVLIIASFVLNHFAILPTFSFSFS